jgi:hypothetical protein
VGRPICQLSTVSSGRGGSSRGGAAAHSSTDAPGSKQRPAGPAIEVRSAKISATMAANVRGLASSQE